MQMVQQGSLRKIFALKLAPECCCFEKFAIFPYGTRNFMQLVFSSVELIGNLIENRTDIRVLFTFVIT